MSAWIWAIASASGFGLMLLACSSQVRPDPGIPWANGLIAIGPGPEGSSKERPLDGAIPTRLRLLRGNDRVEAILGVLGRTAPRGVLALEAQLRPKLILLPATGADNRRRLAAVREITRSRPR